MAMILDAAKASLAYVLILAAGDLLASLVGVSARSWVAFLGWRWLLGTGTVAVIMMAAHFLGIAFGLPMVLLPVALWWLARWWLEKRWLPPVPHGPTVIETLPLLLFGAVLLHGLAEPLDASDPITIYATNARVFEVERSLAPERLKSLAAPEHIEYPPLIALNEALLFFAAPSLRSRIVKPMFALFLLAFVGLLLDEARRRLPPRPAAIALLVVTLTPALRSAGESGFADLPLAAFVLGFAILGREALASASVRPAIAAGLLLGFGALTKNEGLALALITGAAIAVLCLARRVRFTQWAVFALTALGPALAWLFLRTSHGIDDPLFRGVRAIDLIANRGRVPRILAAFMRTQLQVDDERTPMWGSLWIVLAATALLVFASRRKSKPLLVYAVLLLSHLGLYTVIFVLTPYSLSWHLESAGPRLVLHLVPWAALLLMAVLETTAEIDPQHP
ncbi:MAG: hypothetical protein U1E76_22075 [Planctomycetota bacterium]